MTASRNDSGVVARAKGSLARNRDYRLLWSGQALAEVGIGAAGVALPVLVLAVTGSAVASGVVVAAYAGAQLAVGVPAGVLVDRWDRRRVLVVCEAVQAVAAAGMAAVVWAGVATVPVLMALAAVLGGCRAVFEPAEAATLPALVPADQLSTAVAMNAARGSLGMLAGNAAGGVLYALRQWAPFGTQALAHAASFVLLLFLRVPARQPTTRAPFRRELAAGLRFVWQNRTMRAVTGCVVGLNFLFQAFYLVTLALVVRAGAPPAEVGLMAALLGAGGVVGALAAPRLCRVLAPRMAVVGTMWAIAGLMPLVSLIDNTYAIGGLLAAAAFLAPTASTAITTYQLLNTPDELRGRMAATVTVALGLAAVTGPATGGLLADTTTPATAALLCAAATAVLALAATPALRGFPTPR
ncbi:MFS transporter [Actinokineospora sp. NPDC004072]